MSRTFVFLGPSVPVAEAREILDATYLPPASMGDVFRLIDEAPTAIAIIDGVFERQPAVWHKEILHALDAGIPVFGAASMGALRAAELDELGMIGIGSIYAAYRDGVLTRDDEVAVAHASAEHGYRPSSEALVNIRDGLRRARAQGLITATLEADLLALARARYYPDRSWPALFEDARAAGVEQHVVRNLDDFVRREQPNLKRDDALALLRQLAQQPLPAPTVAPARPATPGVGSYKLIEEHGGAWDSPWVEQRASLGAKSVATFVNLTQPDVDALWRHALRLNMLAQEAWRRGLEPTVFDALRAVSPRRTAGATSEALREDLQRRVLELEDRVLRQCRVDAAETRRHDLFALLRSALALDGRLLDVEAACAQAHLAPGEASDHDAIDRSAAWAWFMQEHPHAAGSSPAELALACGMRLSDVHAALVRLYTRFKE